jgi:hypothetical protein
MLAISKSTVTNFLDGLAQECQSGAVDASGCSSLKLIDDGLGASFFKIEIEK